MVYYIINMLSFFAGSDEPQWKYDELQTLSDGNVEQISDKSMKDRFEWINEKSGENGWSVYAVESDVTIEEKDINNSGIPLIRATKILKNVDINKISDLVFDSSLEEKQELSDEILLHEKIKTFTDKCHLARSIYKIPFLGISDREFLALRTRVVNDNDGSVLIGVESVNNEDNKFDGQCVRGISICATYLKPIPDSNDCKIVTLDLINPKGAIPTFVINSYKKKAAFRINRIQEVYNGRF